MGHVCNVGHVGQVDLMGLVGLLLGSLRVKWGRLLVGLELKHLLHERHLLW